jgi:hypothetical protein
MSGIVLALAGGSFAPAIPVIGSAYGGGFFAGQISTAGNGVADYNLVVAPKSSGEGSGRTYKTANTATAGTTSTIDGPTNSANMNNASHPAAQYCEGLSIGGFTDWYLPARDENDVIFVNLKPNPANNNALNTGGNPYSIPPRASNYVLGNPTQTTATDFKAGGSEAYNQTGNSIYWSSTSSGSGTTAYGNYIAGNGQVTAYSKTYIAKPRGMRRVAV